MTTRTFTWEAEVPVLTDGTNSTYALLMPNSDNPNVAVVNGMYTPVAAASRSRRRWCST